jgi:formylglycine-generating enzyme
MVRRGSSGRSSFGIVAGALIEGLLTSTALAQLVTIQTVPVGNPNNAADTVPGSGSFGYGSVNYNYSIGKYDVTIGQYMAFLNAVAAADPNNLWNVSMTPGADVYGYNPTSGIARTGSFGSYAYTATNPNFPITEVSFWNACRFANWLQNGQPTGNENASTTENGTYDLTIAAAVTNNTVVRNAGATWAVASENEWYKAAYYAPTLDGGSGGYWQYPTKSNTAPNHSLANAATDTNDANYSFADPTNYLTAVGTFAASPSAYGTYDQGGDVWQWNDTIIGGSNRGLRGGSFSGDYGFLQSSPRSLTSPLVEFSAIGFRVVQVPEPASLASLGFIVVGLLVRWRGVRR